LDTSFVHSPSPITADQQELTFNLYKCLDSILENTSNPFQNETTLDHDDDIDIGDSEDPVSITPTSEEPLI